MAIPLVSNFSYQGQLSNFERDSFNTLEEMRSYPQTSLDDGHISYCKEDRQTYKYDSNNSDDSITGKWRLLCDKLAVRNIQLLSNMEYSIQENTSQESEIVYNITTTDDVTNSSITLASTDMKWCNGVAIDTVSANKTYVVSVLNNMVVWGEF